MARLARGRQVSTGKGPMACVSQPCRRIACLRPDTAAVSLDAEDLPACFLRVLGVDGSDGAPESLATMDHMQVVNQPAAILQPCGVRNEDLYHQNRDALIEHFTFMYREGRIVWPKKG